MRDLKIKILHVLSILFIAIYACTFNGEDGNRSDVDGTKCDIKCYKDYVNDTTDCLHEQYTCAEQSEDPSDCIYVFCNCYVAAEVNACKCAKNCHDYLQDTICPCLNNCEPYCEPYPNYNCSYDCWQKLCESKWLDCDCMYSCGDEYYYDCLDDVEEPIDEDDFQLIHQCTDNLKTCWLGCISE